MQQQIYVVDDNPVAALRLTKAIGASNEVVVTTFTDPQQALRTATAAPPDLMLVDFAMPRMDGVQLIQELRRGIVCRDMPVAMISGFNDPLLRSRALQAGALDVIAKPFDVSEVRLKVRNLLALTRPLRDSYRADAFSDTIPSHAWVIDDGDTLAMLEKVASIRDENTGLHTSRMARYSYHVARTLGHSLVECEMLLKAAPLHDIGKIGIPDAILLKPGGLTPAEWETMRKHTWIGHDILKDSHSEVMQLGAEIALNHHEQWSGSGYPRGLKGINIPISARIVAVCDSFDALTSVRPYKAAWTLERAMAVIRADSGEHFDPKVVEAFEASLPTILDVKRELDGDGSVLALLEGASPALQLQR